MRTTVRGIELEYEVFGTGRPLLLIMGLGMQMVAWDEEFIDLLVAAGHQVVRFDNRDIGLSTHLDGPADLMAAMAGDPSAVRYTLEDMAVDTAGLMDTLGWESAHVAGVSMGGMIAQTLAIAAPERVRSLTSIMSTPGLALAPATEAAMGALMSAPARNREEAIERAFEVFRVIGSPGYPSEPDRIARVAGLSYDRCYDPAGSARQLIAIVAAPDRTERLRELSVPTLVMHGDDDPLITPPGGVATADAVPGAKLLTFPGMGHDLPRPLWPEFVAAITELTGRAG
ncbi:alpha/beta hydrolase [Acrocarpospora phusangensis]|uniref:Alpha/beta hydrolase n=1 Tax=Acrocarpospora phusangensis TaxID=1070424 RepID=A0A919US53_9ACTN|nr:alpha/beta fold hydrolase [Acrocarpospora phusangensis]GIH26135.1 alpha/beta hydrolase [Acrocarpospora phusangensis]